MIRNVYGRKEILIMLLTMACAAKTNGQKINTTGQSVWFGIKYTQRVSSQLSWESDGGSRFLPDRKIIFLRTGIKVFLKNGFSVSNGLAFFQTLQKNKSVDEWRVFHYFQAITRPGKFFLKGRIRLEEIFFSNPASISFRERAGGLLQCGKEFNGFVKNKVSNFFIWNEYFIHPGEKKFLTTEMNRTGVTWEQGWSKNSLTALNFFHQSNTSL